MKDVELERSRFFGGLTVFADAWRSRHAHEVTRTAYELQFLPAHLELVETPPHPAGLWTARVILVAIVAIVLLAVFGRLDIVAVAPGQVIPSASVKVIQPAVPGVVRQILVRNGDRVGVNQLLVELDPTLSSADAQKARVGRVDVLLAIARANSLLKAQKDGRPPVMESVTEADPGRIRDEENLARSTFGEYQRKLAALQAELTRREASENTTQAEIEKLRGTLPLAEQQERDYRDLAANRYVSSHEYLERQRIAIEQRQSLVGQQSRAQEIAASIAAAHRDIESLTATFQREQLDAVNQADLILAQRLEDETKASARNRYMQIRSPVPGIVQQLTIHTLGGVVSSAQPIMEIVPDEALEIEARVSNRDIGFVNAGQNAVIKVSTFPYTRYGHLDGQVTQVSNSASADKRLGSVFLSRVRIPSNFFDVNGKSVSLAPGMDVTVEIKTGRRSVWEYFLSPLVQTGSESLHER